MKKLFVFIALTAVMHIPISCDSFIDNCGGGDEFELFIEEMIGDFGRYNDRSFNASALRDTVSYQDAVLNLQVTDSRFVRVSQLGHPMFIHSTFACSPIPPRTGHQIVAMNITSDASLETATTTYEANVLLNDLFVVTAAGLTSFSSISEFIDNYFEVTQNVEFGHVASSLVLKLARNPNVVINQDFKVEIRFDDNTTFNLLVEDVLIQ